MKSAVTVALDPCFTAGPFVFHDLPTAVAEAKRLGYDALELFPGDPQSLPDPAALGGLAVSAVGSGAGWVKHKLSFTSPDAEVRRKAKQFVRDLSVAAARYNVPVIIGSMQGRWGDGVSKVQALDWLGEALRELADDGRKLLLEPLNRYESNLLNTLDDADRFLDACDCEPDEVGILADLFHMNIEEADMAAALRAAGPHVGHVHFADSNRRAVGGGHTDMLPVIEALNDVGYTGYLSAEVFPLPDSVAAATATMTAFRRFVR